MKTSYCVENSLGLVIGWHTTLHEAKDQLKSVSPTYFITMMKGSSFGEGKHIYTLRYCAKHDIFIKEKLQ